MMTTGESHEIFASSALVGKRLRIHGEKDAETSFIFRAQAEGQ